MYAVTPIDLVNILKYVLLFGQLSLYKSHYGAFFFGALSRYSLHVMGGGDIPSSLRNSSMFCAHLFSQYIPMRFLDEDPQRRAQER